MGYIYSNSKEYIDYRAKNRKYKKTALDPYFGTIQISSKGYTKIMLSKKVVQEIGLGERAIVGYDKELKRLYVEPTLKEEGTLGVASAYDLGEYKYKMIHLSRLFDFCGETRIKKGRYKAIVAPDKTYVEIDFNCPVEGIKRKDK